MTQRLNPYAIRPELTKPLIDFAGVVEAMGLEHRLLEMVKIRASQINGCAVCLHMHAHDARAAGETEERILMLDAWRETPLYTPRERAALEWTEALTRLTETGAPDEAYKALAEQFTEDEQVKLSIAIATINAFNRLGVGFRIGPVTVQRKAA